ncbi:hypothetical protein [Glycomyces sp. NRRL B-16210]|uniref:hypothetical protein n=1 Tax=Glycomyces sp. NRRL B-16210 TaxID=1463821 RepID=UPI00068D2ACD|nr:hypothetical protein [Glycomyces sp. NRRL B-16210]
MSITGAAAALAIPLACCVALVGGTVLLVLYTRRARNARIAQCAAWAARHGFQYWPDDPTALGISGHNPFDLGHSRRAYDVLRGRYRDAHLHCFQYVFVTGGGRSRTTHTYQVYAISLPKSRPYLDIRHENALSRRFEKDLDFENQAFNDEYRIESDSPRFAYDVIHPRTMEWMLADQRARSYQWRFEGSWLMTFRTGGHDLDQVFHYADFLHAVLGQVPAHVWSDPNPSAR